MNTQSYIHDHEVPNLVNKLIRFVGKDNLEKCLVRYRRSLQSSGPVFREYYLKTRHPWWEAFLEYFNLEKAGKSIKKNLTRNIKLLAFDAKKISTLQRLMPEKVREKYKRDLIDDNRSYDYLFEIHIAWHFYLRGCKIRWYEDDSKSHLEFLVKDSDLEFNVECKRISVDIARKIKRRDFYRFADKLVPLVQENGFSGSIDLTLKDRLDSSEKYLNDLCTEIVDKIRSGYLRGTHKIQFGLVSLNLKMADGTIIDLNKHLRRLFKRKRRRAHGAIFTKSQNMHSADPLEMTITCERADNILEAIKNRLSEAGKRQLDVSKPGLICCYLEGIEDLIELAKDSGLQFMTSNLLSKDNLNHIAAVSYVSENIIGRYANTETQFNQGLIYKNPYCKFERAKKYKYLSNQREFEYSLFEINSSPTTG